jgi:hypothetical protein
MAGFCYLETSRALQGNGLNPSPTIAPHAARSGAASRPHMRVGAAHLGCHITVMYNLLTTSFSDLWQSLRSAKIDMRMTRRIAQRLARRSSRQPGWVVNDSLADALTLTASVI